ncbi:uncharacterized protein DUF3883 [Cytobacillus oceanisediminis]|uniref:Uncharacterized protein DUF3883 n=1 Tax=Cytobacillus oceanisediminis TaxID=665099 RepID=A0A2V3A6T7_9BACI|nr:DUF3883 domain-containing protein [Cytobacillus oceanisediminis]PWW32308.1 uncharacterized protein DUF3883 [Cytobacillus oceanisediminis]
MEKNHKLALIVAFYLSKFNKKALLNLNFSNFTEAFRVIGEILNVKQNTIKNMRDEFDPLYPNGRQGWYQRELRPSRLAVLEQYDELSEEALNEIVKEIISPANTKINENIEQYVSIINSGDNDDISLQRSYTYTTRGITGKKAEDLFIEYFNKGLINGFSGDLIDRRQDGCGYDFETKDEPKFIFEVKGLLGEAGGINLTDKEWRVAKELKDKYILVLISNIENDPNINIYSNPYNTFIPSKVIARSISINWIIDSKQLF